MTDNEIVKALECCSCAEDILVRGKTYKAKPLCDLFKGALDLINRLKAKNKEFDEKIIMQKGLIDSQKAEIENLNVELVGMRGACESYKMHYDNAQAEIKDLKSQIKTMLDVQQFSGGVE